MPKDKHKKGDKKKKAGKKESQLAIRVEKSERDDFVALCDRLDTSAAREIRRFMREFVAQHELAEADASPVAEEATSVTSEPEAAEPEAAEPVSAPKRRARAPRTPPVADGTEPTAAKPRTRRGNGTSGSATAKRPRRTAPKATPV